MHSWNLLLDIVILLAVSLSLGTLCVRFRQSPLIGYLLAGMFLGGPGSFSIVQAADHIDLIAELGVSLLLFSLGLEFSWHRLKSLGANALLGGVLQVALTAAIASILLWLFACPIREALALGAMLSLSSTACVLRVLMERGESESSHGRNSLAILLVQDMAVVPHAIVLTLLGGSGGFTEISSELLRILLMGTALVAVLYVLLNQVAMRLLANMTLEQNRELAILLAVVTGLGSAWAAHAIEISPALGAFISGMFLGSSPFATQIRADIASIRVVLLTLFFSSAGMIADPGWILANLPLVLTSTVLLIVGKTLTIWLILSLIGQATPVAFATGLVLSQIGEFAFVLAAIGQEGGVLRESSYQLVISTAIITLFITPYLIPIAPRLGVWVAKRIGKFRGEPQNAPDGAIKPEVVVIGFGPSGEAATAPLVNAGRIVSVLDLNSLGVSRARDLGFHASVGDARQVDVLEHLGVTHASTILISVPDFLTAITVLSQVRRLAPDSRIIVRSRYQRNSEEFRKAGADLVIGDEEVVGTKLAEALLA